VPRGTKSAKERRNLTKKGDDDHHDRVFWCSLKVDCQLCESTHCIRQFLTASVPIGSISHLQELEEVNVMEPMVTLVLCLPAALVLIACGCGVVVLWPSAARPADHPAVGRRRGRRAHGTETR
jgi:hypothetical protein